MTYTILGNSIGMPIERLLLPVYTASLLEEWDGTADLAQL